MATMIASAAVLAPRYGLRGFAPLSAGRRTSRVGGRRRGCGAVTRASFSVESHSSTTHPLPSLNLFQVVPKCLRNGAQNWVERVEDTNVGKRCSSIELETAIKLSEQQQERQEGRRQALAKFLLLCTVPIVLTQRPGKLLAEEAEKEATNNDQSIVGGLLSLFDPNETTKLGKKLPKAYLKSARDVVKTLRESFSEDSQNDAKFRRNADSAKGAIREYIANWRGANLVDAEESYQALERALRVLSEFYSKKGPSAAIPEDVRGRILDDLQKADDAL